MPSGIESETTVKRPRFQGVSGAVRSLALATLCSLGLGEVALWLLDLPPVTQLLLRLAWLLTPWRELPNVLVPESVPKSSLLSDLSWSGDYMPLFINLVILASVGLMFLQAAAYFCIAGLYRTWGWPQYARQANWRAELWPGLGQFAWRAVWVLPAIRLVSNTWQKLGWALVYAGYPALLGFTSDAVPYVLLVPVAPALVYAWLAAGVVRRRILAGIGPEQRRCEMCDYLLRGLPEPRCPECGISFSPEAQPALHLGPAGHLRWRLVRWLHVAILVMALTAPVWVTLALVFTPLGTRLSRPLPGGPFYSPIGNELRSRQAAKLSFPLRGHRAWLVRSGDALAVICMERVRDQWYCHWAYWPDGSQVRSTDPTTGARIEVFRGNICGEPVQVGPWMLGLRLGSFGAFILDAQPGLAVEVVAASDWPIPSTDIPSESPPRTSVPSSP
jgi:hypothetical protein